MTSVAWWRAEPANTTGKIERLGELEYREEHLVDERTDWQQLR
jgi:hypothetical protein